jgi:ketosteroid isomerase-like protein
MLAAIKWAPSNKCDFNSLHMHIQSTIAEYHRALDIFSKGNPDPVKKLYSQSADSMLANPFGSTVKGWDKVSEALDFASSRFREGEVSSFKTIATYKANDLLTIFEIEAWKSKVGGKQEISSFNLRVTTTFRKEQDNWKLVHRHADPISSFNDQGPIRKDL